MKLEFIALDKLEVSKANMRYAKRPPDISDILPTVRARGVITPLIVRPNGAPDRFEIVAGSRRFHAACCVAEERAGDEPDVSQLPCAILDSGDDADAIEASLIENLARLDPDEVTQWQTFVRLVKEGRTLDEIAATFGLPELAVKRVLALGNLLPRIRSMYAREGIDRATVRHLTLASKGQQRAWLALADDPDAYLPTGHQLKAWLFGGQSIRAAHALFDVDTSGLALIADLFGEDRYFVDADAFWIAQNAAVEARRCASLEAGWTDALVVPPGEQFHSWEYEKAPKRKGGRVYFDVRATGEVIVHEGYLTRKEARRLERADVPDGPKPPRPEISSTMQTYIDLHRHAAVRAALVAHPQVALRLMVAHAIAGSHLWAVKPEPQTTKTDDVRESVETSKGEADFDEARRAVLTLLDFSPEEPTVIGGNSAPCGLAGLFLRLLDLPDRVVLDAIPIVIGESLAAGSAAVEAVGMHLGVDMARYWQADDAFFGLLRDREVLTALVAEVAGERIATANIGEKTKTLKQIIADHLDGANGRNRVENWVPRWMAFPPTAYTGRGGVGTVRQSARVAAACVEREPDPDAPAPCALPVVEEEPDEATALARAA